MQVQDFTEYGTPKTAYGSEEVDVTIRHGPDKTFSMIVDRLIRRISTVVSLGLTRCTVRVKANRGRILTACNRFLSCHPGNLYRPVLIRRFALAWHVSPRGIVARHKVRLIQNTASSKGIRLDQELRTAHGWAVNCHLAGAPMGSQWVLRHHPCSQYLYLRASFPA